MSSDFEKDNVLRTKRETLWLKVFQQAWKAVIDRHGILRSVFAWENQQQLLQIVYQPDDLPWTNLDWRSQVYFSSSPFDVTF
ncbi:MAG: hypothetical protein V7L14_33005 [Nostoc sp.]